jgi:hypothetical protein
MDLPMPGLPQTRNAIAFNTFFPKKTNTWWEIENNPQLGKTT